MTTGLPVFRVGALTADHVAELRTWRYEPPWDCYDLTDTDPHEWLDPEQHFWGVFRGDELVGFRSFGRDGQVPGWAYDDTALDTGGGLRPDLTGRGWGAEVIGTGLAFGRQRYAPRAFRVTIASWNTRALRTVDRLGFQVVGHFTAPTDVSYDVLVQAVADASDEPGPQHGRSTAGGA